MENNTSPKSIAIVSYITIIGWIVALVLNKKDRSELSDFHIRQALGIHLMFVLSRMLGFILGGTLSSALSIFAFILLIIGILDAIGERSKPIPLLGEQFQEWFKTV